MFAMHVMFRWAGSPDLLTHPSHSRSLARSLAQTTVVMNTVLRAAAVLSSVPPFSVVVDSTTLVTVAGALVVMVAVVGVVVDGVVGSVVVCEMDDLSVLGIDAVTLADVEGEVDIKDDGDSDGENDAEAVDVANTIPLLSTLDNPTLGTKMRGMGGTNAI